MEFSDIGKAKSLLSIVGYYRFSGYAHSFKNALDNSSFIEGTTFDDIFSIYCFDRELKLLLFDSIERIEISFRTYIINAFSVKTSNPFWYVDDCCSIDKVLHDDFMRKLDDALCNCSEDYMSHFRKTYEEAYPPCWMGLQIMSFGNLVNLFRNTDLPDEKRNIAHSFGCESLSRFISWMNTIVYFRNICGHHARLWNRAIMKRPDSYNFGFRGLKFDNRTLYYSLFILKYILNYIYPDNTFKRDLSHLLQKYPFVNSTKSKYMGFPSSWEKEAIW